MERKLIFIRVCSQVIGYSGVCYILCFINGHQFGYNYEEHKQSRCNVKGCMSLLPCQNDMAGFRQVDRRVFPLQDISSVVRLFKKEFDSKNEPDLALLSIIVGAVENSMTCNRAFPPPNENDVFGEPKQLPAVEFHIVDALYSKFHAVIKGAVDLSLYGEIKYATRELVKRVSDVIWNSLTRSYYKDRAHLQSLYSYLTGESKLYNI